MLILRIIAQKKFFILTHITLIDVQFSICWRRIAHVQLPDGELIDVQLTGGKLVAGQMTTGQFVGGELPKTNCLRSIVDGELSGYH